jgi:hypothetical protein
MLNLVSEWKFDEVNVPSAGKTPDSWSGGNTGTLNNSPAVQETGCISGKCLKFDGSDDYVSVVDNSNLRLISQGTISLWIKPESLTQDSYAGFVSKANGGNYSEVAYSFSWRQIGNVIRGAICGNSSQDQIDMPLLSDLNWHYLVFFWNGSYLNLYIDGLLAATPVAQTMNAPEGIGKNLKIGGYTYEAAAAGNQEFSGLIDEVRIYNLAISASQIKEQYYAGLNSLLSSGGITQEEYLSRISNIAKK